MALRYSAVVIDATGVRGGTAKADAEQTVTLDYVSQGEDATASKV